MTNEQTKRRESLLTRIMAEHVEFPGFPQIIMKRHAPKRWYAIRHAGDAQDGTVIGVEPAIARETNRDWAEEFNGQRKLERVEFVNLQWEAVAA